MAAESSTAPTSGRSDGGGVSADSYIGSLISLTSKSEIRYEGILYNINTEESSIGLRNVRSFGTEGRKNDGPQIPPSDKIYEYILFRGSDIKDLQVKASPPVQATPPPINSDPAIIQSNYLRPQAPPSSLPAPPNGLLPDNSPHSSQMGLPGSTFQNNLHLYQPGSSLNSWNPSPPNANGPMTMYWPQGYYGPPNGMPQLPKQSLLRPPPSLSIPPTMQQMQFSGLNSSFPTAASTLPDYHLPLAPNSTSASSLTSTSLTTPTLSLTVPPLKPISLISDTLISPLPNKAPVSGIPTLPSGSNLPSLAQLQTTIPDNAGFPSVASKPSVIAGPSALPQQTIPQPGISFSGPLGSVRTDTQTHSLITPGQLLHSAPAPAPASSPASAPAPAPAPAAVSLPQTLQSMQKDIEVVPPEPSDLVTPEAQPPILPLPTNSRAQKPNGGGYHMRNNYRGRGGRGPGISRPVARFTEDFDFMAMNEKFKKDEVWGHLGKTNKSQSKDKEENGSDEEDDSQGEYDAESPKIDAKPVYNKDDFFDSLSCNALDNNTNHGRTRYSEQMKLDTETFGDFSRYRGGRGGRGPGRGGGRFRGSYHGGGYGGYGYYVGRGRGRGMQSQSRPS